MDDGPPISLPILARGVNDDRGRIVELDNGAWCSLRSGAADVARRLTTLIRVSGISAVVGRES